MSSASEPECSKCHVTSSPIWRRNEDGAIICLECHSAAKKLERERLAEAASQPQNASQPSASGNHTYKKGKKGGKKGGKGDKNKNSGAGSVQVASGANKGVQKSRRALFKSKVSAVAIILAERIEIGCDLYLLFWRVYSKPVKAVVPEPMLRTSDSIVYKVSFPES